MVKVLVGFLAGVVVGAAAALLYAPSSGVELRTQLRAEADADYQKFRGEWQNGMGDMQSRLDQVHSDLNAYIKKTEQEEAEAAA